MKALGCVITHFCLPRGEFTQPIVRLFDRPHKTHRKKRSRFDEHFLLLVCRAALVGHLGRAPLPGLQVQRGPDHVEEGEQDEAQVLEELGATAQEELTKKNIFAFMMRRVARPKPDQN